MITLTKPTNGLNIKQFIEYYNSISINSPISRTRYIRYENGLVKFSINLQGNTVYLTDLESVPDKIGLGTRFMNNFCQKADEFKVDISIFAEPFGTMKKAKLKQFYTKFNFKPYGSGSMMRKFKVIETADSVPKWFKDYTKEQQDSYLENHPNSKLAKQFKKDSDTKVVTTPKPITKDSDTKTIKTLKIKDAKDYLAKNGSPTDFKGPTDKNGSPTGNVKADRYVSALLDKLADLTEKAIAEGKDVPDYNLCEIQVPGTNLFCEVNLGVERKNMPQLKGKPEPGSWGDTNLDKDSKGEVDGEKAFRKMLQNKGIKITSKKVPANSLKATQSELVGSKVAGMTKALQSDPHNKGITAPIFISKDGYVLDGHHRWAAQVGLGIKSGIKEPIMMDSEIVDMTMEELLSLTNSFCEQIGIKAKAGKAAEHSSIHGLINRIYNLKVVAAIPLEKEDWNTFAKVMKDLEKELKKLFSNVEINLADHHLNSTHLHIGDKLNIRISVPTNTGRGPQTYNAYQSSSEYDFKFKPIVKDTAKELSDAILKWFKLKAKQKVISNKDNSPNTKVLHTADDLKDYFKKGEKLVVINNSDSSKPEFKVGTKYTVSTVTNAGVWIDTYKNEFCLETPKGNVTKFIEVDNNNFTYVKGNTKITFSKK